MDFFESVMLPTICGFVTILITLVVYLLISMFGLYLVIPVIILVILSYITGRIIFRLWHID